MMESKGRQACCSFCRKAVEINNTTEDQGFIVGKRRFRVCSHSCSQSLQYLMGLAHGFILLHVLNKLCREVLGSGSGTGFDVSLVSVKNAVTGGVCRKTRGEGLSDTTIKREPQDLGHLEDGTTDLKVFFDQEDCSDGESFLPDVHDDSMTSFASMDKSPQLMQTVDKSPRLMQTVDKSPRLMQTVDKSPRLMQTVDKSPRLMQTVDKSPRLIQNAGDNLTVNKCVPTPRQACIASSMKPADVCLPSSGPGLQCRACQALFPSGDPQALAEHLCEEHTKDIDLVCDIRGAVFRDRKLLRQHKKNGHGIRSGKDTARKTPIFNCDKCSKEFSDLDSLQEHHRRSHSVFKQDSVHCDECGKTFRNATQLNRHTANKHKPEGAKDGKTRHWCSQCNKEYPTRVRLQRHHQFVHSKQLAADCSVCGKSFRNKLLLRHHVQFMHSKQTPGACPVCGKTYRNTHLLKMHMKVVHKVKVVGESAGDVTLQCIFCTQTFPAGAKSPIADHLTELHAKEVSPSHTLCCDLCDARFKRKVYLTRHMNKVHHLGSTAVSGKAERRSKKESDSKRYPCDKCGKTYTQSALSKHIRIYHTTQEPVDCDVCGKTLINSFHLNQHKRQHVSTKICHICGAKFKTDAGLRGHLAAHKGTKSHVCEVCGVGFVRKTSWQRHVKLHSESVPLHCEFCPKTFKTVYSLNSHVLAKHHRGVFFSNRLKTLEEVGYHIDKQAVERHLNHQCATCGIAMENGVCLTHPDSCTLQFRCNYCQVVVRHVDTLCQHLKTHSIPLAFTASTRNFTASWSARRDDSDLDHTCQVCHKTFQRRENLAGHMKQHQEKAFACPVCFRKFTYKCNLKNHLTTHSQDKPFQCEVCHKAFKCKQLLGNHRLVHDLSQSPFKCQVCGKGLTRKFFLQRHYRQMHPGVLV